MRASVLRSRGLRWTLAPVVIAGAIAVGTALPVHGEIAATAGAHASASATGGAVVVTFGDSVPAGTACDCTPFPDLYAHQLPGNATSVNLAQSGYTTDDVLSQVETADAQAALRSATIVLLMIGANDFESAFSDVLDGSAGDDAYASVAEKVDANVSRIVNRIRQLNGAKVPVLVLGYWNVMADGQVGRQDYGDDGEADARTATLYANNALQHAASQVDARYVATDSAFMGPSGDHDPTALLADDGDHPNAQGHAAIAAVAAAAAPQGQ